MAASDEKSRGAVFTRQEVVEFILDLCGYTADQPLYMKRLLEPSFGHGEFLKAAVHRLVFSWQRQHPDAVADAPAELLSAIRAVELHHDSMSATRLALDEQLARANFSCNVRNSLLDAWLVSGDFLLTELEGEFDYVVGNPPYVRQESIPGVLVTEYRRRYQTLFDRADLYVLFFERSLAYLAAGGQLSFICSDRWTKNKYGAPLRDLIASSFHMKIFVDMVDTPAFNADVIAYPAITVIERNRPGPTRVAIKPAIESESLARLARALRDDNPLADVEFVAPPVSGAPWLMRANSAMDLVRRIEANFPPMEATGCKVGIGVATGADRIFIGPMDTLDVEPTRKLPLLGTQDILSGDIAWKGLGVINPFEDDGSLADLARYPRFASYLFANEDALRARHVAKKSAASWYRTIDRITPALMKTPKLLVPDIKGHANIVLDTGNYYPHHNLYHILSEHWDIRALQTVLRSGIARLFVAAYSTRMRGGYLRYQAQYLRRIRLPAWKDVPEDVRRQLLEPQADGTRLDAVARLYNLAGDEQKLLAQQLTDN